VIVVRSVLSVRVVAMLVIWRISHKVYQSHNVSVKQHISQKVCV
jgi:hypothetical protein